MASDDARLASPLFGQVGKTVATHLASILSKVDKNSTGTTKVAAFSALLQILDHIYNGGGQGKVATALGYDTVDDIVRRLKTVARMMDEADRQKALPQLGRCALILDDCGAPWHLEELSAEPRGKSDEEEAETEEEDSADEDEDTGSAGSVGEDSDDFDDDGTDGYDSFGNVQGDVDVDEDSLW